MYQITIGSEQFKGKRTLEQHKMVNQVRRKYIIIN